MFFKLLPTLTKTKLDQAKIIFKSDHQQMGMTDLPKVQFADEIKREPAYDVDAPFLDTQETYDNTREYPCDVQEFSHDTQSYDIEPNECVEIRVQDDTETNEENIAEEVIQYLQQLQEQGVDNKYVKVIYVENGQVVGVTDGNEAEVDENNKEESDSNIGETIKHEKDSHVDNICAQYDNVVVEKLKDREADLGHRENALKELMSDVKSITNMDDGKDNVNTDSRSNMRNALRHELTKNKRMT